VKTIATDKKIREQAGFKFGYTPGSEVKLRDDLKILLDSLKAGALDEAEKLFRECEARKKYLFGQGVAELSAGKVNEAKGIFDALATEFNTDIALLVDIAEAYEKAGMLEEAALYLEKADKLDPGDAYIKNKLGIIYRKLRRFEASEAAFKKAIILVPDDAHVYFNSGRLYLDLKKWAEAKIAADKALECQPDFNEARMMADYAAKQK
jgi:tetratricopeptide (TPR) repeat protein